MNSANYYIHPQEVWDEKTCKQKANFRGKDGCGIPWPYKGLVSHDGSAYPSYGQTRRYNGGCIREENWYQGESVPLPKIPDTYEFVKVLSWGTQIRKKVDK